MARGGHIFRLWNICKQTYIIAQTYARHLMGDTGSTGRYISMCLTLLTSYYQRKSMYCTTLVHGKNPCEFCGILTFLRWFLKLSHSAVAVPHHCRPLYTIFHGNQLSPCSYISLWCVSLRFLGQAKLFILILDIVFLLWMTMAAHMTSHYANVTSYSCFICFDSIWPP